MKIYSIVLFYLFLTGYAFSQEIHAELNLISPPAVLQEGDIVEGVLKVWPLENADLSEFRKLENMILASALNITEVENIKVSANNADLVEVTLLFIVKRSVENTQQQLTYKGQNINLQIPPLKIAPPDNDPEDYYILDQGTIYSNLMKIAISALSLTIGIILIIKRKSIRAMIGKFKDDPIANSKNRFDHLFSKASKREEFEEIYAKRRSWLNLIKDLTPAYDNFLKTMELHQYKEFWNTEELNEVKNSFEVIRRSFK